MNRYTLTNKALDKVNDAIVSHDEALPHFDTSRIYHSKPTKTGTGIIVTNDDICYACHDRYGISINDALFMMRIIVNDSVGVRQIPYHRQNKTIKNIYIHICITYKGIKSSCGSQMEYDATILDRRITPESRYGNSCDIPLPVDDSLDYCDVSKAQMDKIVAKVIEWDKCGRYDSFKMKIFGSIDYCLTDNLLQTKVKFHPECKVGMIICNNMTKYKRVDAEASSDDRFCRCDEGFLGCMCSQYTILS